jgi:hypothetical protein
MGHQSITRPLPTQRTTQTQNKNTQTSLPRMGFEPTTPVFERAKTVHALERAVTVIELLRYSNLLQTEICCFTNNQQQIFKTVV